MKYAKKDTSFKAQPRDAAKGDWLSNNSTYISGKAWVDEMDIVARDMEQHWGVDRLRLLIEPNMRERFDRQRYLVNDAIWNGELEDVRRECQRMIKAWRACDVAARAAGHRRLNPQVWEIGLEDGSTLALCRTQDDAHAYAQADGRGVVVWSLEEIGRMVSAQNFVQEVKRQFPGAAVSAARPVVDPLRQIEANGPLDDPIPF